MATFFVCLLAVALNLWLGEPRHAHPLSGFGRLAAVVERRLNRHPGRGAGLGALALLTVPFALAAWGLSALGRAGLLAEVLLLYLSLGATGLLLRARAVSAALRDDDLARAGRELRWLVGSERVPTQAAPITELAASAILARGSDAVFAPLFWYLLLGAPGVVLYRLTHTLAALWGQPLPRYRGFGWAAVGLDRLLGWVPARLTALTYATLGDDFRRALRCWCHQGRLEVATNSAVPLAAGAGALGVRLGGLLDADRPLRFPYGEGEAPLPADLVRAGGLVKLGIWLWLGTLLAAAVVGLFIS